MSDRYFTADDHFNHANVIRYAKRPQLKVGDLDQNGRWISQELARTRALQMNAMLIRNANSRVKAFDRVVCVGDFSCRGGDRGVAGLDIKYTDILSELNGEWTIVRGNHDKNNSVKTVCDFMTCNLGRYRVGVQHRPLFDVKAYEEFKKQPYDKRIEHLYFENLSESSVRREVAHSEYCKNMFDFMICGHVHEHWHTNYIAGIWHVNVGVDVNRYMPISDSEVMQIYEKVKSVKQLNVDKVR